MRRWLGLLLVMFPMMAEARPIPARPPYGILQSCSLQPTGCVPGLGPTGVTGDPDYKFVATGGAVTIVFQFNTGGTVTVTTQVEQSVDEGRNWILVAGSSTNTTNAIAKVVVLNPAGWYRTNVTGCPAGCTYETRFWQERAVGQSW